jgi:hydrogenase nickel incorporation protein HypB
MFRAASLLPVNGVDHLPHLDFDVALALERARMVNSGISVPKVSAKTGEGMEAWYAWNVQAQAVREAVEV